MHAVVVYTRHRTDGYTDLLLTPEVPFVEKYVGHLMVTRIDDESTDTPDWTVRCMDMLTTSDFDFSGWDFVGSDGLRPTTHAHTPAHATHTPAHATHSQTHATHSQTGIGDKGLGNAATSFENEVNAGPKGIS